MLHLHRRSGLAGAAVAAALLAASGPVAGAGQRSFVSTSGVDNPTCSITSPCRGFNAAITATAPGGEVIALDSGGYGQMTITKSLSIIAPPGVYAGISVSVGDGVSILTVPTDAVTLRGLTINNVGMGARGIFFNGAGRLFVSDVTITGFLFEGLRMNPLAPSEIVVERSAISRNGGRGISIESGAGVDIKAVMDGLHVHHNTEGIFTSNTLSMTIRNSVISRNAQTGVGVFPQVAGSNTQVTLISTEIALNGGRGVWAGDPNGAAAVTIDDCTIVGNNTGIDTTNAAQVRLAGTTISRNATGIAYAAGGLALSQGNNLIDGNTADGAAPAIVGAK